ncbi:MauE/DoxX family redox-associated membrane protein [Geomonas azotofigens]|uniref:MauE/DoxX family redox-associated membrane protein n=1 Tax=Geomonas azotofigens TaxID=2843196 RepID=UPI001C126498|nr:MauE/DoxX family redox-associated membrane protein [Geomonas azotofigens]MBU5614253.1 DoxX family membrane protein [Geomonas azotofigens]
MKTVRTPMIPLALRIALGAIFIYAAIPKIADPVAFAGSVAAYRILPYFWSYVTAAVLPFLELACGVLLICGIRVRSGALIIGALNVVFMAALSAAMVRGLDIDCGCFRQEGAKTSPWVALLRDAFFLAMTVVVLRHERLRAR